MDPLHEWEHCCHVHLKMQLLGSFQMSGEVNLVPAVPAAMRIVLRSVLKPQIYLKSQKNNTLYGLCKGFQKGSVENADVGAAGVRGPCVP